LVRAEQVQVRRREKMKPYLRVAAAIPLLLVAASPFLPMWFFQLNAPFLGQRWMEVYVHPLSGVGGEVENVNVINHYVGLGMIGNEYIPEIAYLPYVYTAMIFVTAVFTYSLVTGRRRAAFVSLLVAIAIFVSILGYMYNWLYNYTHTILPGAPMKIEPFDPPFLGEYRIANFVVRSFMGPSLILQLAAVAIGFVLMRKVR